jgi:5-methylcytosine-specific restriction endonuclease McrA
MRAVEERLQHIIEQQLQPGEKRDGGTCQYAGRKLSPKAASNDHVLHRLRRGKTSWDNCVLANREVNSRKASRLPHDAGLRLRKKPVAPRVVPASALIRNHYGVRDGEHFLG